MKVLRYLKSYAVPIIIIVLLLFIQSFCDLSMPSYMSNIVNIGIQQGGVESIVPQKVTNEEMKKLELFMRPEDAKKVDDFYTQEKYNEKDIKVLNSDISKDDQSMLEDIFQTPMLVLYLQDLQNSGELNNNNYTADFSKQFSSMFQMPTGDQGTQASGTTAQGSQAGSTTGQSTDTFAMLAQLPDEQRVKIIDNIEEKMSEYDTLGKDNIKQMVVGYVKQIMSDAGVDTDSLQNSYILLTGLIMLAYAFLLVICTIIVSLLASKVGAGYSRDLRGAVYKKVIGFSSKEINHFSNASLITRCTNDIQQVQMVIILFLRIVLYAPILGIGSFVRVMSTGPSMSWIIIIAVIGILALVITLISVAMPKFTILQKLVDKLNLVSREILTGLPVIRAFSREKHEEARFDTANTNLMKTNLFVNKIMTIMMPTMMFIMNGISVLIVWVGAKNVDAGNMQVGDIMAFIQYTMMIIMSFLMISMMSIMLPRAIVSGKRIGEVLKVEVSVSDPEEQQIESFDQSKKGYVEFKDVYFRYPQAEEDVLRNISFVAKPGQTTAFIGSTGSGKSTLVNLIPRFFDVTGGKIFVDGADIKKVKLHDLREKIGYVPQKGVLFSGTIASNIAYGPKEISQEQIEKAAEIAQSTDFITAKEKGFEDEIAQGGTNVSGGQRQRLSIARAIAKDPEIYIFDDSFSALDYKTDIALRKALYNATANGTILIVAQRISTVLNADQIIVLDNGEIAGIGTHRELMDSCSIYQQIAESQLSKEELA